VIISTPRASLQAYSVLVHVTPDSSSNFTGEQDDKACNELQNR